MLRRDLHTVILILFEQCIRPIVGFLLTIDQGVLRISCFLGR